jgi:hypothetical protein
MTGTPPKYHSFDRLQLTISESSMESVRTDHTFELRSTGEGAEVWRWSVLVADGGTCESPERYIGWLGTRKVIDLLEEIRRSGVYEALPAMGIVEGTIDPDATPLVSMRLVSDDAERDVLDRAPADTAHVGTALRAVQNAIALAQERALASAG